MSANLDVLRRASLIYPQPVAISCTRLRHARNPQEQVDAALRCAEVLTRYLAALAFASFAAREDATVPALPDLASLKGNLSFGNFLAIGQRVAGIAIAHPLRDQLAAPFRVRGKEPPVTEKTLVPLLNLRNELGHDLSGLTATKATRILIDSTPLDLLESALEAFKGVLSLPLFLVEEQKFISRQIVARRLLLMGDSRDPDPEDIPIDSPLGHDRVPYVAIGRRALPLAPFLTWDLASATANWTLYFLHSIPPGDHALGLISLDDERRETDEVPARRLRAILAGEPVPADDCARSDGLDFQREWQRRHTTLLRRLTAAEGAVPWEDFDAATLAWYADLLAGDADAAPQPHRAIVEARLLDGRDELRPEEVRQLRLLFGREEVVRRAAGRALIDCRSRRGDGIRWDDRVESTGNIVESLKLAIEFYGRHLGVGGVTLDGLKATSGSADYLAMREALVNVFIHQDYGDQTAAAQVIITADRAQFFNPGASLVDEAALAEGDKSQSRNPLVARALRLIGFAELAGSGILAIHQAWRSAGRRPPLIKTDRAANTFELTLDWRPLPDTSDPVFKARLGVSLDPGQMAALALAADPAGTSVAEIASATGALLDDATEIARSLERQALVESRGGRLHLLDHLRDLLDEARRAGGAG